MAVKLQDFIGGRINPTANPKHKVVSEFLTHNHHKQHGFDEKTAFIVEAVYEKIMAIKGGSIGATPVLQPIMVTTPLAVESTPSMPPAPLAITIGTDMPGISDLGSLIKKSDGADAESNKMSTSGKSALASMTTKW